MPSQIFFFMNNQEVGPYDENSARQMIAGGQISPNDLCWYEGLPEWKPIAQALPQFVAATHPPRPAATAGVSFRVEEKEYFKVPSITINNAEVVLEAGALQYMIGHIEVESNVPGVGKLLKSALTKEKAVRPRYRGTGTIYLEPTMGECHVLELKGEEWILDKGAFMACEPTIQIDMFTNKAWSGFFGGEGFFQTRVSGYGKVMLYAQGPLQEVSLQGQTLVVDGSFAVARTGGVNFSVERVTKSFLGSMTSGEGLVNTFSGQGTVLIAPIPNRFLAIMREFGFVRAAISRIKSG